MKINLLLFLFSVCLNSFGQEKSLPEIPEWMGESCENGVKFAQRDAKKGIYKTYVFGLPIRSSEDWAFSEYYENYLLEKYNVISEHLGCVFYTTAECYSNEMNEIIKQKFGENFFEIVRSQAKNEFQKIVETKIETGFVFNYADENPKFIGGEDSLFKFLERNIKYPSSCINGSIKGKVYCQFIIEKMALSLM